jgi:malonyl-CoA O-methyltransferase
MTAAPPPERRAVRRNFARASRGYDGAAQPHAPVRQELVERCRWLLQGRAPQTVLDLGAGTCAALPQLRAAWPAATVLAVDFSLPMLAAGGARLRDAPGLLARLRRLWRPGPLSAAICADAGSLPLAGQSVDLVYCNLLLHWCRDPDAVLREIQRVLRPDGLLVLSTWGPDTLFELRAAWAQVDTLEHVMRFFDMHDIGEALLRCGFREPVLDVDRVQTRHRDAMALMHSLRDSGAANATAGRRGTLTGRRRLEAVFAAYPHPPDSNQVSASWEVVYASAFAGGSTATGPHEFSVDAAQLTNSLALRRQRPAQP